MDMTSPKTYDIAVIGGGVVGCAVLRAFTLAGLSCLLLERGADILSGASAANLSLPDASLPHTIIEPTRDCGLYRSKFQEAVSRSKKWRGSVGTTLISARAR